MDVQVEEEKPQLRLDFDRMRLDEEWADQPKQFHVWSTICANAQLEYDNAKSKLDLMWAELDNDIRSNPTLFGHEKVTEQLVKSLIVIQPPYQAADKKLNAARHKLEVAKAAVNALEHRKRALTMSVELFIKDYYSEATVGRAMTDSEKAAVRSRGHRRAEQQVDGDDDSE